MIRRVMAWKATGSGDLTILRAPSRRLTKLISESGVVGYEGASAFEVEAARIDRVEDLAELLEDLAGRSDSCVIRGALRPGFAGHPKVLRRSRDRPGVEARFVEVPRTWVMVDVEHLPCPPGVDPTDPLMVGGAVRMHLPAPFRVARCVSQLSSQAGLEDGLRCHLWFVLDRPLVRAELKRWLEPVPGVDLQVFTSVQPHYVARPIFAGVDDPCPERLAVLPGYPEVAVPDLPDRTQPRPAFAPVGIGKAGPARAEAYAQACLRRLAMAPEGRRHPTCVAVSCKLLALAKGGLLDPIRVAARIKGVMRGRGFDGRTGRDLSEVDSILEWAWTTVQPEGLHDGR
jgi:hypothetical protein